MLKFSFIALFLFSTQVEATENPFDTFSGEDPRWTAVRSHYEGMGQNIDKISSSSSGPSSDSLITFLCILEHYPSLFERSSVTY